MEKDKNKQIAYWIFVAGLLLFCMIYIPYLLDYYLVQSKGSFLAFYLSDVLNEYCRFEGILIVLFIIAIWIFTGKAGIGVLAAVLPLGVLNYASLIKYKARGELLRLSDLTLEGVFAVAVRYIEVQTDPAKLFVVGCLILLVVGSFVLDRQYRKIFRNAKKIKIPFRIALGVCCLGIAAWYAYGFFAEKSSIESLSSMGLVSPVQDRCALYNFLKNDGLSNIGLNDMERSYRFFQEKSDETVRTSSCQYPNVIVIMNESWWNTDYISGERIYFSRDPMEPYRELEKSCSSGHLTANIFGGGTVASELEFLSGLNGKYGVGLGAKSNGGATNIFDYFCLLDYETVIIHPYYGDFYSRKKTYADFGVDKMIFEEDMDYTDIYSMYISDESLAKQIIKEYEEREKKRSFIYAISIANHIEVLDYKTEPVKDYAYPIDVDVKDAFITPDDYHVLINYVNGIYLANLAFAQLVSYFEQQEEPVVIVMYGDHSPGFSEELLEIMGLGDRNNREVQKFLYSVPVLIWSNQGANKVKYTGENVNYLPQMLIEYANLPEADMTNILKYERSIFKTDTECIVEEPDGSPIGVCDKAQMEALLHYRTVEYGIRHGYDCCANVWMPYADK